MDIIQGIYKIENQKTGKVYIGQAKNIQKRFREHQRHLKNNSHHSAKLQRSYNKTMDKSIFKFSIVEVVTDANKLDEREQFYIDYYDSFNNGYNCCNVGIIPVNDCDNIKNKKRKYYKSLFYGLNDPTFVNVGQARLDKIEGKSGYTWQTLRRLCVVLQWFRDNYDTTLFSLDVGTHHGNFVAYIKQNQECIGQFRFEEKNKRYMPISYFGQLDGEYQYLKTGDSRFEAILRKMCVNQLIYN